MVDPMEGAVSVRFADPARDLPALVALNRVVQDVHARAEPSVFRPSDDLPGIERFHRQAAEGGTATRSSRRPTPGSWATR